jgi:hypothetical protein
LNREGIKRLYLFERGRGGGERDINKEAWGEVNKGLVGGRAEAGQGRAFTVKAMAHTMQNSRSYLITRAPLLMIAFSPSLWPFPPSHSPPLSTTLTLFYYSTRGPFKASSLLNLIDYFHYLFLPPSHSFWNSTLISTSDQTYTAVTEKNFTELT